MPASIVPERTELESFRRRGGGRENVAMKRPIAVLVALTLLFTSGAWARNGNAALAALPNASDYSASVLPDIAGVVSWKTLAQVVPVKRGSRFTPSFSKGVLD